MFFKKFINRLQNIEDSLQMVLLNSRTTNERLENEIAPALDDVRSELNNQAQIVLMMKNNKGETK